MSTLEVASLAMLVLSGVFTGVLVAVSVERVNLWSRMPVDQYAVDFRRSLFRLDPLQPILGTTSAVAAVVFALKASDTQAALAWVAVGCIALIMVTSIAFAEPMNSRFRKVPEGQTPEGAADMRRKWRLFHYARTALGLAALVLLAAAASNV